MFYSSMTIHGAAYSGKTALPSPVSTPRGLRPSASPVGYLCTALSSKHPGAPQLSHRANVVALPQQMSRVGDRATSRAPSVPG